MKIGDNVYTPRFCTVKINEVFDNARSAREAGYIEPTHYHKNGWTVLGKAVGNAMPGWCKMEFAAVKE